MSTQNRTGSRMELVGLLDSDDEQLVDDLLDWQYAAIARFLAEACAVHPAVHTPARVMQWLEQHGWERRDVGDLAIEWTRDIPGWRRRVFVPTDASTGDYSVRVGEVLRDAASASAPLSQVLTEVAAMPDEWSW